PAPWGDVRVHGAANIAAALSGDWEKLGLARVAPLVVGTGFDGVEEYEFALYTHRGTRVYWGHGCDNSLPGEPTTDEKAARLRDYVAQRGSLDAADAGNDLDLRSGGAIATIPRSAEVRRAHAPLR
ncbi:MAG: hypothetical protein WD875_08700, partial [Pirellulales bacterium]